MMKCSELAEYRVECFALIARMPVDIWESPSENERGREWTAL